MYTKINTHLKTVAAAGLMAAVGFTITAGDALAVGKYRGAKRDVREISRTHTPAPCTVNRTVEINRTVVVRDDSRNDYADKVLGTAVVNFMTSVLTGEAPNTHALYDHGDWAPMPVNYDNRGWDQGRKIGHRAGYGRGCFRWENAPGNVTAAVSWSALKPAAAGLATSRSSTAPAMSSGICNH
ncbi:MAG: hypothetical protein VW268_04635 [Rhodospirillaceae bacterium]